MVSFPVPTPGVGDEVELKTRTKGGIRELEENDADKSERKVAELQKI